MKQIGYHYTGLQNWTKIQADKRMMPYDISSKIPREWDWKPYGIFVWPKKLEGESHVGTVLFQFFRRRRDTVVLLEVKYDPKTIYRPKGLKRGAGLDIFHDGEITGPDAPHWVYHRDEKIIAVTHPIPIRDVRCIAEYDLFALLGGKP